MKLHKFKIIIYHLSNTIIFIFSYCYRGQIKINKQKADRIYFYDFIIILLKNTKEMR